MECTKFAKRREPYRKALAEILQMGFTVDDYIHRNPAFAGHMNVARFLALYETYKQALGLAGDIAEVGVWKASSLLYFAKLTQIFEPESKYMFYNGNSFGKTSFGYTKFINS